VGAGVLVTIGLFRRELTIVAFDRVFASANGINVWLFDQLFLVLLSLTIVISLQTVGNVLVLAMLITPAATARLLTDRLRVMVLLAALIGASSGVAGLYASYHFAIASGASVVLVATAIFTVVYLFAPRSGIITVAIRRRLHYPHPERDVFLANELATPETDAEPASVGHGRS
jgi:ABC-type Mn2+/Zn2+ transport system permease subunit